MWPHRILKHHEVCFIIIHILQKGKTKTQGLSDMPKAMWPVSGRAKVAPSLLFVRGGVGGSDRMVEVGDAHLLLVLSWALPVWGGALALGPEAEGQEERSAASVVTYHHH